MKKNKEISGGVVKVKLVDTRSIILITMFVVLITVGAFIKIPAPLVPFTLQFLFITLAGLLLGAKNGAIAVAIYIICGIVGLPVFSSGGGIGYIFQPTFGYIIGFGIAAFIIGGLSQNSLSLKRMIVANFVGLLAVYAVGMLYYFIISNFYLNSAVGVWSLFLYCFILAAPGDIALCILGAFVGKRLKTILYRGKKIL